jgi:hypothetical protein
MDEEEAVAMATSVEEQEDIAPEDKVMVHWVGREVVLGVKEEILVLFPEEEVSEAEEED